jgi:hypothetical protein
MALALGLSSVAHASEVTRVATAFEPKNTIDLHVGVGYDFQFKQAAILREWGVGGSNRMTKDLTYQQVRHELSPSLELGLFRDLSVYLTLPVVLSDDREYAFDQRDGSECIFPEDATSSGTKTQPTCVNRFNSSTIRDGLIPQDGYDATAASARFGAFPQNDTKKIFVAPNRRGIDQLYVGLKYGILNQEKLKPFPSWVLALEGRFAVGPTMKLTRSLSEDPAHNHAVGRRIHELGAWTALSYRYRYFEPFFTGYWRYSTRAQRSLFEKFSSPAQTTYQPLSNTGIGMGVEVIPWSRPERSMKFSIILSGTADLHYGGRAYSEVWELLADSPAMVGTTNPGVSKCNAQAALSFASANPSNPAGYLKAANEASDSGGCKSFAGPTTVQDYASFGMQTVLNFHMGPYARLNFGARLRTDTQHFLTYETRGTPELSGDKDTVDPNTRDVNPLRRDVVDNAGRRFAIDDVVDLTAFANLMLTF